ncbi:MAG: LPD7 domain-containing protein [Acidiferrobacter sp.]
MARGSSIHFKPVPAGGILAIAHNTREVPPRDLLPQKHHLGNVSIVYGDVEATYREKMALASPKARATKGYSPLQEGVLNLPDPPADHLCAEVDEWKRDMERRVREFCAQYQQVSGHRVLRADIHLDEGHVREDGSVGYNVHCHICADKTDERGRVVRMERRERGADGKEQVVGDRRARGQKLQDLAAEITGLERGEKDTSRKHIDSHAYRALARQGRILSRNERERQAATLRQYHGNAEKAEQCAEQAARERDEARKELSTAKALIGETAQRFGVSMTDDRDTDYKAIRAAMRGQASQADYMALRAAHEALRAERDSARAERDQARRERDDWRRRAEIRAKGEEKSKREPTDEDIARARAELIQHARRHRMPMGTHDEIRAAASALHREWRDAGGREQYHYMALRIAREQIQADLRAQRVKERIRSANQARRRRDRSAEAAARGGHNELRIGGVPLKSTYHSAELAAARACGLRYEWDPQEHGKRYRDQHGAVFLAKRETIKLLRHDEAAEVAALRVAAAKWSGKVSILGSAEFRGRMARMAAREGIGVENHDLQAIVRDEHESMALGEPGPGERAELDREARQQLAEQEQDADDELDQGR